MPTRVFATATQQTEGRVAEAGDLYRPRQRLRRIEHHRLVAPDRAHRLVGDQDQREGGEHLRQVVACVEPAQHGEFEQRTDRHRAGHRCQHADHERAARRRSRRSQIGADHVQRAMRQVDHVHDPEDERQPSRQQKEHEAELDTVEGLFKKKLGHRETEETTGAQSSRRKPESSRADR